MSDFSHDLVIIGAGPGGYVAAIRAAQLGLKVAVVEKDTVGGVCLNLGCIPTKALLHEAERFRSLPEIAGWGIAVDPSGFDYTKVWQKSRDAAARLAKGVGGLLRKNKVELVAGTARLNGKGVVQVSLSGGETQTLTPRNTIIATGSRPRDLPGFEFDGDQVLSSDDLLRLQELPASLAIMGAGAIGVEFACIMASFGVKVTLLEAASRVLPQSDAEASKVMEASLRKLGVTCLCGVKTGSLNYEADVVSLECVQADGSPLTVKAEKLLVAVGRTPNTEQLGLDSIGIKTDKGLIPVGDYYQTPVAGIFAIGDVVGNPQLAHVASKEGELAVEFITGQAVHPRIDRDAIPYAVYAEPEIAGFGPSEDDLRSRGIEFKAFSFPFLGVGKAVATGTANGFVKIIQSVADKRVVAATIAGPGATDLIHELLLARDAGISPAQISRMIHAHPTFSEGIMEAARGLEGWAIHI